MQAVCLGGLLLLLPFEPRRAALQAAGLKLTLLELAAAICAGSLALSLWRPAASLLRRPPLPLSLLSAYAAAHVLSALLAPENAAAALKFSLRMVAMAAFAWLVAAAPARARRAGFAALGLAGALVAALALVEGVGVRSLDPFLSRFREMPFNVAGTRRASGGSEYPNLAAAFVMYGLLAAAPRLALRGTAALAAYASLAAGGLLFTYSRGALAAALCGLLALAGALGLRSRAARPPLAVALVLVIAAAVFAWRGETFRLRLGSEGTSAWYAAEYSPQEASLTLAPGEERTTLVRVTNRGLKSWRVEEQFHLSYHWYDLRRRFVTDGPRTLLPRDVLGGESALLAARVRAPRSEGDYLLVWDMVHERTTWFSGQGVAPASVPVRVAPAGAVALAPPPAAVPGASLAWRPSRWELWRLALAMWRERPLTGVGPDNFRWLYGPRAGQPFWDARVYANATLLEAAATTGTLGALALGGCLLASLASGLSHARAAGARDAPGREALASFALLAGIAAHGVVDYVLAFTGHYLVLGFAVGAVAAPDGEGGA
jgi:hypothetical protein